jgi:glycosyltransferase involved in cell wall biosynthesis
MPYFNVSVDIPPPDDYQQREANQIKQWLPTLIAEQRPDVIFIGRESFVPSVSDLARECAVPCILRIAGSTAQGLHAGNFPDGLRRQFIERLREMDCVVVQTRHFEDILKEMGIDRLRVIPNAIDLRQFAPRSKDLALMRQLGIDPGAVVVAHPSNLKTVKRPLDVVESARRALPKNRSLIYLIIGNGTHRQAMEDACRRYGIMSRFRFVGWVDYDLMPAYIALADIVVMPSQSEAQARVYLETQASARLLLASEIPGALAVVRNGETGLLFRMGDIDDLTSKTLLAASDAKLRADIGRRARERVKIHSLDAAVTSYLEAIQELIDHQRAIA